MGGLGDHLSEQPRKVLSARVEVALKSNGVNVFKGEGLGTLCLIDGGSVIIDGGSVGCGGVATLGDGGSVGGCVVGGSSLVNCFRGGNYLFGFGGYLLGCFGFHCVFSGLRVKWR